MLDFVFIVVIIVCLGLLVTRFRMLNRSQTGSLIEASWEDVHTAEVSEDPMPPPPPGIDIPSESQKVSSWEGLPTVTGEVDHVVVVHVSTVDPSHPRRNDIPTLPESERWWRRRAPST